MQSRQQKDPLLLEFKQLKISQSTTSVVLRHWEFFCIQRTSNSLCARLVNIDGRTNCYSIQYFIKHLGPFQKVVTRLYIIICHKLLPYYMVDIYNCAYSVVFSSYLHFLHQLIIIQPLTTTGNNETTRLSSDLDITCAGTERSKATKVLCHSENDNKFSR